MPSKFIKRDFKENSYYHIFNRGVEARSIFQDDQDFRAFLFYLYMYTTPLEEVKAEYPKLPMRLQSKNLSSEVKLLGYCLMPNHFHLLLQQKSKDAVAKLMKQSINGYTIYFNQRNKRIGALMQGRYKAALIDNNDLLAQIWRFIHLNPVIAGIVENPRDYEWSSYGFFCGRKQPLECSTAVFESRFASPEEVEKFHQDKKDYLEQMETIKELIIEAS